MYPSCVKFKNAPYMDFNLLVLTSFEVTTMTSTGCPEPTCWGNGKAGNGNEAETGNGNWKWKLEMEMGTKNTPITGAMFSS